MRITSLAVLLALISAAHASAQVPRLPGGMRRGTFTARWTASSVEQKDGQTLRSTELLDATIVFDIAEGSLMLRPGQRLQLRSDDLGPPVGHLVSARGKVSYSGDEHFGSAWRCPEPGFKVEPSYTGYPHTAHEEGVGTWQADAGQFSVEWDSGGRVESVIVEHPLRVTTKTTSPCPNVPPSTETKERHIRGGDVGLFDVGVSGEGWSVKVDETATGYAGTARFHRKGVGYDGMTKVQAELTKDLSFTLDLGGPLRPTAPGPLAAGGQRPLQAPGAAMVAPGMAPLSKGEAVFVQGGKAARWQLASGGLMAMGGVVVANLTFSAGGQSTLALIVGSHGGPPAVTLQGGPAGDAEYDQHSLGCALQLDASAPAGGIAGTITCTKGFNGVPITKLTFRATP